MRLFHGRNFPLSLFVFSLLATLTAQADLVDWSKVTVPVSATYQVGGVQNHDYFLQTRIVDALTIEAFPNYPLGIFRLGPHFAYSYQWQLSKLQSDLDTNLKGHLWAIGLGAKVWFTKRLFSQLSVDFLGDYTLSRKTETNRDAGFRGLTGAYRLKTGYRFLRAVPALTLDFDISFLRFRQVKIAANYVESPTQEFAAGIGFTYRFGGWKASERSTVFAKTLALTQSGNSMQMTIPNASFNHDSAKLKDEALPNLKALAEALMNNQNEKIMVEGYTDNSGDDDHNQKLSQARAESVRSYLILNGVNEYRIQAVGFGAKNPVASNETDVGKALNRRVQIRIERRQESSPEEVQ